MPVCLPQGSDSITPTLILNQLEKMLHSTSFAKAEQSKRMFSFVVSKLVKGEGDQLKEYSVGVEALDRTESFDPAQNPLVRVYATRLRERIRQYYLTEGSRDKILISLPKGNYRPIIGFRKVQKKKTKEYSVAAPRKPRKELMAIAVFPFLILGNNARRSGLAAGLAEELTHGLSQIGKIRVAPRTSVLGFSRDTSDVCWIGRQLNVRTILEGSVTTSHECCRTNLRLVSVRGGYTVWSTSISSPMTDSRMLAIQLATAIVAAMHAKGAKNEKSAIQFLRQRSQF